MQILQWLLKTSIPESPRMASDSTSIPPKQRDEAEKTKSSSRDMVVENGGNGGGRRRRRVEKSTKLSCDDVLLLRFVQRKDVSQSFFYHTLNLKSLGSFFDRSRSSRKTAARKRPEKDRTGGAPSSAAALGGNKVLPIADSAQSRNDEDNDNDDVLVDSERKRGKKTVSSRMKELLKWSATAKTMKFKNGLASKATTDDDQVNDESPKISFRWEIEGCSTTTASTTTTIYTTISTVLRASSVLKDDQMQCADTSSSVVDLQGGDQWGAEIGNWITTDSEFVVLEL